MCIIPCYFLSFTVPGSLVHVQTRYQTVILIFDKVLLSFLTFKVNSCFKIHKSTSLFSTAEDRSLILPKWNFVVVDLFKVDFFFFFVWTVVIGLILDADPVETELRRCCSCSSDPGV